MFKLLALCFVAGIAVVHSNRCHVSDDDSAIHCGDVTNMTCASVEYTPVCKLDSRSHEQMNGVCTCEHFCLSNGDCSSVHCWRSHPICRDAYTNSIEKLCVCVRN